MDIAIKADRKEYMKKYHHEWYLQMKRLGKIKKRDKSASTFRNHHLYSVRNNKTDDVVIIDGNWKECCKAMGISEKSFYTLVSKAKSGKSKKWTIVVRKIEEEERV